MGASVIASSLAEMGPLAMLLFYVWLKIDKGEYGLKPIYDGKPLVDVLSLSVWSSKILRLGYAVGFLLIGVAVCCNRLIIGIYTDNELLTEQAFIPFVVTLLNYTFALPGSVYLNVVGGTGKTRTAFVFQVTITVVYLGYLYWLSSCTHVSLVIYLTAEYLFVILLALQSFFSSKSPCCPIVHIQVGLYPKRWAKLLIFF